MTIDIVWYNLKIAIIFNILSQVFLGLVNYIIIQILWLAMVGLKLPVNPCETPNSGAKMGQRRGFQGELLWVYFMENPNLKWMMTGGSPILGNLHIYMIYCEWELDYSMTYVPTYIAIILPQPRGRYCRPFGSSITAGPPRKQSPMPKLCIFFCRCGWEQIIPVSTKNTYISERISDSQVISRRSPTEPTSG